MSPAAVSKSNSDLSKTVPQVSSTRLSSSSLQSSATPTPATSTATTTLEDTAPAATSCPEKSVKDRLLAALANRKLTDVELVGDDGIAIPASRFVLSSASSVLEELLENFESPVAIAGFTAPVLKAVVEYCCANDFVSLKRTAASANNRIQVVHVTKHAVQLAILANMLDLQGLHEKAVDFCCTQIHQYPTLSCLVYSLVQDDEPSILLKDRAIRFIVGQPERVLVVDPMYGAGLACLNAEHLEVIMRLCCKLPGGEFFLIQMLLEWKELMQERNAVEPQQPTLHETCRRLAALINLTAIPPQDLSDTVLHCGLYDTHTLLRAFREQAIRASWEGIHFERSGAVEHLWVSGAGVEQVNGIYYRPPDDLYCFYKNTVDSADPVRYWVYRSANGFWKIGQADVEERKGLRDFYKSTETVNPNALPNYEQEIPHINWATVDAGVNPRPVCVYYRPKSTTADATTTTTAATTTNAEGGTNATESTDHSSSDESAASSHRRP